MVIHICSSSHISKLPGLSDNRVAHSGVQPGQKDTYVFLWAVEHSKWRQVTKTAMSWQRILLEIQCTATESMSQSYERMGTSHCTHFFCYFLKGLLQQSGPLGAWLLHSSINSIPIPQIRFNMPSICTSSTVVHHICSRGSWSGALEHRSKSALKVGCRCPGHRTKPATHKAWRSKEQFPQPLVTFEWPCRCFLSILGCSQPGLMLSAKPSRLTLK